MNKKLHRGLQPIIVAVLVSLVQVLTVSAQESGWSTPIQLNQEHGSRPDVVVGIQDDIHIFWGGGEKETRAIFYTTVSKQGVESPPHDILVSPQGHLAEWPRAVVDPKGQIHLVWTGDVLYYSRVNERYAGQARAWALPQVLSTGQASSPGILIDRAGRLHVVYADIYHSPYIRHTYSEDRGQTWSQPSVISSPSEKAVAINVQMAVDQNNVLHVIWAETIEEFPPSGVYYARSHDHGRTWTQPYTIAEGGYSWGSVGVDALGQIHLFWTGTGAWSGKYHCWSSDGGQTWTPTKVVWPGSAGFLGFASLFTDTKGVLHIVSPASYPETDPLSSGEIYHSIWSKDRWTEPENLSATVLDRRRENQMPSTAVSADGTIHVVWQLDNPDERETEPINPLIWYTASRSADTTELWYPVGEPGDNTPEDADTPPTPIATMDLETKRASLQSIPTRTSSPLVRPLIGSTVVTGILVIAIMLIVRIRRWN